MEPGYRPQAGDRFTVPARDKAQGAPTRQLFAQGRDFSTVIYVLRTPYHSR
ncbi:hypothetical protein GCM10010975_37530 [Comamonas phosphati]|nr:hypothetical protein GCM10010975_37530 [Comamonas phosphati]